MHDSDMAGHGLYKKMEEVYQQTGEKVVVDSAFKLKQLKCLIKSSQSDPRDEELLLINRDATSIRQLSEWGMRMIQGGFPRIKDCMKYEEKSDRKIIFMLLIHIYNFKTTNIGMNTILNSYMETRDGYYEYDTLTDYANDYIHSL